MISAKLEFKIKGQDYYDFVDWCFQHAVCFTMFITQSDESEEIAEQIFERLRPYQILSRITTTSSDYAGCFADYCRGSRYPNLYMFRCCEETKAFLKETYDSIYFWQTGFFNLAFYNSDMHFLMRTETFDNVCLLNSQTPQIFETLPNREMWWTNEDMDYFDEENYF